MLENPYYFFTKNLAHLLFKFFWRVKIIGLENVPKEGPIIIASNHRSYSDPPLVGSSLPRDVHFLAKQELFRFRPFGWYISKLNAHPLNRSGGDVAAFRLAAKLLKEGNVIIVFPEGKRNKTDQLAPGKPGVAMLAKLTKSLIVPTYVHNSDHLIQFKKLTVTFGRPIDPAGFDSYEAVVAEVMKSIELLSRRPT